MKYGSKIGNWESGFRSSKPCHWIGEFMKPLLHQEISGYSQLPYARHHNPLLNTNPKDRMFWKKLLEHKEMDFKNGVINIQAEGYNGARTVYDCELSKNSMLPSKTHLKGFIATNEVIFFCLSLAVIKSFEFSELLFFLLFFIVAWKATTIFRQSSLRALDRVPWFTEGSGPLSPHFLGLLGFLLPLSQNLGVFSSGLTVLLSALALNSQTLTFPLQHDWCYKTLDLKNKKPMESILRFYNGLERGHG